jgi:hypothetical protein
VLILIATTTTSIVLLTCPNFLSDLSASVGKKKTTRARRASIPRPAVPKTAAIS